MPASSSPHLCADAGHVGERLLEAMIEAGYMPHVRPRGEEKREKRSGRRAAAGWWRRVIPGRTTSAS